MTNYIRIPKTFYIDHVERDLPAPPIVGETKKAFIIDADHPDIEELAADARFYADPASTDCGQWLRNAARGLLFYIEETRS